MRPVAKHWTASALPKVTGLKFIEFATPNPWPLRQLFEDFGFLLVRRHKTSNVDLYQQNGISLLINYEVASMASKFSKLHGPSVSAMGWTVEDMSEAHEAAVAKGAQSSPGSDYVWNESRNVPAVVGIGGSLIYFIEESPDSASDAWAVSLGFDEPLSAAQSIPGKGFLSIDHLTNNVPKGTIENTAKFYETIFGFSEVRRFEVRGEKTGLRSCALKAPWGDFFIPINEADEENSQINEYLRDYKGAGVQHVAFLTNDILASLAQMKGTNVRMLDIDAKYYEHAFDGVTQLKESPLEIKENHVLIDGSSEGYLLQIFTTPVVGPIFIEVIQRENHHSFGENNFSSLFRSMERDQMRRGVL